MVRYRVQNDVYHVYTVDEHLLRTVRELHAIEQSNGNGEGLLPGKVPIEPKSRRILYLAALLHDIGKGKGKSHSVHGAMMARESQPGCGSIRKKRACSVFSSNTTSCLPKLPSNGT